VPKGNENGFKLKSTSQAIVSLNENRRTTELICFEQTNLKTNPNVAQPDLSQANGTRLDP